MTPEERAQIERDEARALERIAELEQERDAARAEAEGIREEHRKHCETAEAATRGWRKEVAEVERLRAELAAWQTAGTSTDLDAIAADHLATLADWETETGSAPDWLVTAVVDLLTPITIERDRLARERDAIARADKAGERRARQMIDGLTEKIHRARGVHAPQCGGGCAAVPCECEPGDLVCAECGTPAPCATARALDGEEPE